MDPGVEKNIGVSVLVMPREESWSGAAAEVAVNAGVVHVVEAGDVFRQFLILISHNCSFVRGNMLACWLAVKFIRVMY
jgi:hypothetical protein